jgi:hypothetical protein
MSMAVWVRPPLYDFGDFGFMPARGKNDNVSVHVSIGPSVSRPVGLNSGQAKALPE